MARTTAPAESITLTASGTYTAMEVPPRCRKPRPVTHDVEASATVTVARIEDAPVAFRVQGLDRTEDIRLHGNRLYTRHMSHRSGEAEPFPHHLDTQQLSLWAQAESELEYRSNLARYADRFLILRGEDGDQVWTRTGEPRYFVTTFGMSGNHGSTALMTATGDPSGTRADSVFRADDFEAARAHAEDIATRRRDTESLGRFRATIEVLIPEAVTLRTTGPAPQEVEDLRFEYCMAVSRLDSASSAAGREGPAFAEVVRLREAIIATGHPVVADDSRAYEARYEDQEDVGMC